MIRLSRFTLLIALVAALAAVPAYAAHVNVYNASFQLDPKQEVPPAPAPGDAVGSCVAILDVGDSMLSLSCTHNVTDTTAAHIHFGDRGEAGPVTFPLGDGSSPILFETALTGEQLAAFVTGDYYVNIHNPANSTGILRGQMTFQAQEDASSLSFGGSDAVASCRAVLSQRTGDNDVRLTCTTDFEADSVEVRDSDGDTVATFDDPTLLNQVFTLSDTDADALRAGDLTLAFNTGFAPQTLAIDGCFSDANTLCLNDNRFQVSVSGSAPTGSGGAIEPFDGRAFERTDLSGEFSFFNADNLEILVKVLDGCNANDHYWVFFSALTNVQFDLTVTDTATGQSKTYPNAQGTIPAPVTDTAAFMTCP